MKEAPKPPQGIPLVDLREPKVVSSREFDRYLLKEFKANVGRTILVVSSEPDFGFSIIGGIVARTEDMHTYGAQFDKRGRRTGRVIERPDLADDPKKYPITIANPWNSVYVIEENEWIGPNPALFSFEPTRRTNLAGEDFIVEAARASQTTQILFGEVAQDWVERNTPEHVRRFIVTISEA